MFYDPNVKLMDAWEAYCNENEMDQVNVTEFIKYSNQWTSEMLEANRAHTAQLEKAFYKNLTETYELITSPK
jgi:hypothetical protein